MVTNYLVDASRLFDKLIEQKKQLWLVLVGTNVVRFDVAKFSNLETACCAGVRPRM